MAGVVGVVNELYKCLSRGENPSVAKGCVVSLSNYFEEELSSREIDTALAAVFEERNGVLISIKKAILQKTYKDAVAESLVLLKYLLVHYNERMSPFVMNIKDVCMMCISRDNTTGAEKEKAYECLHELVGTGSWSQNLSMSNLIKDLFKELSFKKPTKVSQKHFHILGTIARFYPENMTEHASTLMRLYFHELDKQGQLREVSSAIVTGCLEGLAEYIYTFSQPIEENTECRQKVYSYVKCYTSYQSDRKIIQRAALKLIHLHGILLRQHLYDDYLWWHKELVNKWLRANNSEDKKIGRDALLTFYEVISMSLQESTDSGHSKIVLQYFINYFKDKLLSVDTEETILVLQGLGKFSQSYLRFLTEENMQSLLILLVQRAQQLCLKVPLDQLNENSQKDLYLLPHYVESIANIVLHLKCTENEFTSFQHMAVVLIQMYAVTPTKFQPPIINSVMSLIYSLVQIQGLLFDDFINVVVYQSVVRSCSSSTESEKYVPLWHAMTDIYYSNSPQTLRGKRQEVVSKVYDVLLATVFKIIKKLDLKVFHREDYILMDQDDPNLGLKARNPEDFEVFLNLVEMCIAWLPKTDPQMFRKWIQTFVHCMIVELYRNPVVSGFYKLLATCFQMCEKLSYFHDEETNTVDKSKPVYKMISKCLHHLLTNVRNSKGDLQVACVRVFLECPIALLPEIVLVAVEIFQIAFKVGRSYLKLASEALTALDKWKAALPPETMKPILKKVIPDLEPFLRNMDKDIGISQELEQLQRCRQSGHKRFSLTRRKLTKKPDSELQQLQKNILRFLGPLDFDIALSVLDFQHDDALFWGQTKKLKLKLPFKDMNTSVYLDSLLPHVVDLTMNCSERQTRIAACELFHAVVVFMLGTSKQVAGVDHGEMSELFEKVFPPLLQLGCDSDEVVNQLFKPLVYQLAHWYSSSYQLRSKNTEIFVNLLLDCVAHPSDKSLRDISAKCLREFVEWSIKQYTSSRLEKSSVNVEMIVKRIGMLCGHPSASKRVGGALAFNSVYKILREDETVVDELFLELLYFMVKNLSLCTPKTVKGVISEEEQSVDHVFRVLKERAHVFNNDSKRRHKPREFNGVKLHDAVIWLLHQCHGEQRSCRQKCMQMVKELAPLVKGCKTFAAFIDSFVEKDGISNLLKVVEGEVVKSNVNYTLVIDGTELEKSPANVIQWLQLLQSTLHCYTWILENSSKGYLLLSHSNCRIIKSILLYLKLSTCEEFDMDDLLRKQGISPWEFDLYLSAKSSVALDLFDFIITIISYESKNEISEPISENFLNYYLWLLVSKCIFNSPAFGFDPRNDDTSTKLSNTLKQILKHFQTNPNYSRSLNILCGILQQNFKTLVNTLEKDLGMILHSSEIPHDLNAAILGVLTIQECGLKLTTEEEADQFCNLLLCTCFNSVAHDSLTVTLQPSAQSLADLLVKVACTNEKQITMLIKFLLDSTVLQTEGTGLSVLQGEHFQFSFRSSTLMSLLKFSAVAVKTLLEESTMSRFSQRTVSILEQLCHFAVDNKKTNHELCENLYSNLIEHWYTLEAWANLSEENTARLLMILNIITSCATKKLGCLATQAAGQWILRLLSDRSEKYLNQHLKNKTLDLLPCLITSPLDFSNDLKDAFLSFCEIFPEDTSELRVDTPQYDSFVLTFHKLLLVLQITGNLYLLERIIAMSVRHDNHICGKNIQKTLPIFISKLNCEQQCKAIEVGYSIFTECSQYAPQIRLNCVRYFIVSLLKHSREDTVLQFFTLHMQQLLDFLAKPIETARMIQVEHNLVSRIGCWWLLEVLFSCVPSEQLESKECPINLSVNLPKGLISDLSTKAYRTRSETLPDVAKDNTVLKELFRKLQCAAYIVLVVMVSCTKDELKFYTGLLFKEDRNKTLWERIVDCTHHYSFSLCFERIPKDRKFLVSIRQNTQSGVQYLATDTQMLVSSTLVEDLTRFDLTTSVFQPSKSNTESRQSTCMEVLLEEDVLNSHECMSTLCALIRHMAIKNLYAVPEEGAPTPELPPWMEQLRRSLVDNSQHPNVRIFLSKIILNNVNIFKPFASYWLYPLMQVVVDGTLGHDINYMVMDIIALLVSWHDISTPTTSEPEKLLASEILQFLIVNANCQRRDVLKYNLDVLRTLVEVWKDCIRVPYQKLLDLLSTPVKDNISSCETAIHVASIFLANKIPPWNDFGKVMFFNSLASFMLEKKVLCPSSEVIGMCLKNLNPDLCEDITEENKEIFDVVKQKIYYLEKHTDKFLHCLHSIQRHYPPILDDFMKNILYHLPKVNGKFKVMCLEMICTRVEALGNFAFAELHNKGLLTLLCHGDSDIQLVILQLIRKMMLQIDSDMQQLLLHECVKLSSVRSPACRTAVFKILMWAFDEGVLLEEGKDELLKGMVDSDPSLQELLLAFWNDEKHLSSTMPNRFLTLMSTMYSSQTEQFFLSYALHLLLDQTTFSSEYNSNMFDHPLSQCDFKQLQVLVSKRKQRASLAPLFSQVAGDTQITQLSFPSEFKIKSTPTTLGFLPTIDMSREDDHPVSTIGSSLAVTMGSGTLQRQPVLYNPETNENMQLERELSTSFRTRRLLDDKKNISRMHAFHEARRTERRELLQQERVKNREIRVSLYRAYRTGDFPDVQIPFSSILKPLQVLSKHNSTIAREVIILLFSGITEKLQEVELSTFCIRISDAFQNIMQKTHGTPMLMGSIFEMILACDKYINLDADIVSSVSQESGLLMLGSLVLEKKLINHSGLENENSNENIAIDENNSWLRLAELYQNMEEWDVVHGVFHEKLNCCAAAKTALEEESEGNWREARDNYKDAIVSNDPDCQKDYYYEAFYRCLAHLSDWKSLCQSVDEQVDSDWNLLWSDEWNKQHLLPQLFVSQIHLLDADDSSSFQRFLKTLQFWLNDESKLEHIEVHFTEELAVLYAIEQNFVKSQVYVNNCYIQFLNDWVNMNTLGFKQRTAALRDVHRLFELQSYLHFVSSTKMTKDIKQLLFCWKDSMPTKLSSLLDWDRKLTYRCHFSKYIKEKFPQDSLCWDHVEVEMQLAMVDASLAQRNFNVAKKYIMTAKNNLTEVSLKLNLQWVIGYSRCQWLRAVQMSTGSEKLDCMLQACNTLLEHDPCKSEEWNDDWALQLRACEEMGMMARGIWSVLKDYPEALTALDGERRSQLQKWISTSSSDRDVVMSAVHNCGLTYFHSAVNIALKEMDRTKLHDEYESSTVAEVYFKIAEYYDGTSTNVSEDTCFLVAILRAMKFGSRDAHYLFPRLLQHTTLDTDWIDKFITESAEIAEWMFLKWINQILACLDKPVGQALHHIVLRVAKAYPQSMTWPYRISREKYSTEMISNNILCKLDALLLQDTLTETFLRAMSCLAQPEIILLHHIDNILNASKQDVTSNDAQKACENLKVKVHKGRLHDPVQGTCFHDVDKYIPQLQKALSFIDRKDAQGLEILKQIKMQLEQKAREKSSQKIPLQKYSPWLSQFQMSPWGEYLELPGQYTGESRPLPQHHVRIAGFLPEIFVIGSLRLPIKLTVIGDNAKEYPFLVKYGEDLRQDQRIQQLFNVMNVIFCKDSACLHRRLNIVTYSVIPLTCQLGIIQWIDGTKTLKRLLEMNLNEKEFANYRRTHELYLEWLKSGAERSEGRGDAIQANHRIAYKHYSRKETIEAYQKRVQLIPWDIFRRAFMNISANPEEFFSRRQKFACNYATMCISHWILGIGDRHLGNCLIKEYDGSCVGIDFGCAFGCGIQFLPVPELMPFRMTPHITHLMEPFQHIGVLHGSMVHSLRALRNASQLLLATMEVFVHEPSINWIELAKKHKDYQKENEEWLPQEKLFIAKKKLEGVNPVKVISNELEAGHKMSKYLNDYLKVVHGDRLANIRARVQDSNLSSLEQVECLMDLATDPHVLGKAWVGWESWI